MINGISEGTATVSCTTADGGKKAECVVNVHTPGDPDVIVSKITLNKTTLTMSVNGTFELDPTLFPSNAYNKTLQWNSSNEDVVSVNDDGDLVAHSTGPVTITVAAVDGGASATFQIVASENMVPAMTAIQPLRT